VARPRTDDPGSGATPSAPATFGTPVYGGDYANVASVAIPITGVVSGQPLVLLVSSINDGTHAPDPSNITDTFSTPYTWYRTCLYGSDTNHQGAFFLGTGGAGTSGTVTFTCPSATWYPGCILLPCINTSVLLNTSALVSWYYAPGGPATGVVQAVNGRSNVAVVQAMGGGGSVPVVGTGWNYMTISYLGTAYTLMEWMSNTSSDYLMNAGVEPWDIRMILKPLP
jgi:hypothetical protein